MSRKYLRGYALLHVGGEIGELPREVDLLLLCSLWGNRKEDEVEEEVEKKGAVKEKQKKNVPFFRPIILLLVKLPVIIMSSCSVQSLSIE